MKKCIIDSLVLFLASRSDGGELFIKFGGKKLWPKNGKFKSMTSEMEKVNIEIPLTTREQAWVEIELWDYNHIFPSSKLGVFKFLVDDKGGPFVTELSREASKTCRYAISWRAV
jgi:hypothetical protein